ncbi:hypothetical protein FAM09_28250 [Niastella caeni]|uniref:Uncharacterized protein n=1 Tax=Niastella caeni TaxID=2569763 RepID=A0A4S8HBP8_9BACT|nr:hypothetical protein [Niastella caeni]THU31519.1 hypothetical protein FAM09_28250 [Niastella caeni]
MIFQTPELASRYIQWKDLVWSAFWKTLINEGILAEVEMMQELLKEGITSQLFFQIIIANEETQLPAVISACNNLCHQIMAGAEDIKQLQQHANSTKITEHKQVIKLNNMIEAINKRLSSPDGSSWEIDTSEPGVMEEINSTLIELEWLKLELEAITQQLNQVNLVLNQLQTIESLELSAITALNNIVIDLKKVYNTINGPWTTWVHEGLPVVEEWVRQINNIRCHGLHSVINGSD